MRIITFSRMVVVPLSVLVMAVGGLSAPPVAFRSVLPLMAVAAIGLMLARWGRSRDLSAALAPIDGARPVSFATAGTRKRDERSDLSAA
jgi:hypothetical protein